MWVAGSTHAKEEDELIAAHAKVRERFSNALLVLVPRHPPRFADVAASLRERGIEFVSRTSGNPVSPQTQVFLLDTLGELPPFYAAGDVAFVGGSLVPIGGHNLLEPAALGLPIQLVTGYKGTAEVRLAAEGGEIAGGCWGWDSVSVTWRKALDSGDTVVVLQANRKTHPDLPNVPQAIKFAKTEEGRRMIEVGIHGDSDIVRTYTLPPGTPKDRVQTLRKAFDATLKDPEFLADAKKSRLNVDPIPAEEIEKDISALFKLDPALVAKLKEVLYN